MYESSDSQSLGSTIGIQSGPDAFDESRFVVTVMKIRVLRKVFSKQFYGSVYCDSL